MTGSSPDSDTPESAEYTEPPAYLRTASDVSMSWGQYYTKKNHSDRSLAMNK
jgi:hypothetical protein